MDWLPETTRGRRTGGWSEEITFDRATRAKLADEFLEMADRMREGSSPRGSALSMTWAGYLNKHHPGIQTIVRDYVRNKDDSVRQSLWEAVALPSEGTISMATDKIVREPLVVSPYAAQKKNWKENFAEAFAFYAEGKSLPPELVTILDDLR